jgi:DNA mismatch repair ATPase MutS
MVCVLTYKQFWTDKRLKLNTQYKDLANTHPDATPSIQQLLKVLCDIEKLANSTPISVGESKEWAAMISSAEDNREDYCKVLKGKTLFSALYGVYTVMLHDLNKLQKDIAQQADGFKEVHRRKRHCNEEPIQTMKKVALPASTTKNFFASSRQTTWTLMHLTQSPPQLRKQFKKNWAGYPQ